MTKSNKLTQNAILFGVCLVTAIFLLACHSRSEMEINPQGQPVESIEMPEAPPDHHTAFDSLDWAGVYHGIVPCASCPGIDTWLIIGNEGQNTNFSLFESYLENNGAVFETRGIATWAQNGTLLDLGEAAEHRRVFIGEGHVTFLAAGQALPSSDNRYTLNKMEVFSGTSGDLFVDPDELASQENVSQNRSITFQGVKNLSRPGNNGYHSMIASYTVDCEHGKIRIDQVRFFEKPFGQGQGVRSNSRTIDLLPSDGPLFQSLLVLCM